MSYVVCHTLSKLLALEAGSVTTARRRSSLDASTVSIALSCYKSVTMSRKYATNALQSQEKSNGRLGKWGQAVGRSQRKCCVSARMARWRSSEAGRELRSRAGEDVVGHPAAASGWGSLPPRHRGRLLAGVDCADQD